MQKNKYRALATQGIFVSRISSLLVFDIFMGFVDNKNKTEYHQNYPLGCHVSAGKDSHSCGSCYAGYLLSEAMCESMCDRGRYPVIKVTALL